MAIGQAALLVAVKHTLLVTFQEYAVSTPESAMSAATIQALVRFLAQDAKVPLALAMSKVKDLQQKSLDSIESLAKAKPDDIKDVFGEEKLAKQVVNAAKRVSKKRAAGDEAPSTPKKPKNHSIFSLPKEQSIEDLEASLALPYSELSAEELLDVSLFSNRAPLVLAFTVMLLKYTMPEQPLSSRLSLAQAYVGTTSRSRAVSLGIETGKSAEEEGFGEGQPSTSIMGKKLHVMRRHGYEPNEGSAVQQEVKIESSSTPVAEVVKPALWALDLEALRKNKSSGSQFGKHQPAGAGNMPIYTPQSARAYLFKSFESPGAAGKKVNVNQMMQEREENLGKLLKAIDLLYQSWIGHASPDDIERRVWEWYVKARPAVEAGVAGWGGKNAFRLRDILSSRRDSRHTLDAFVKKEA